MSQTLSIQQLPDAHNALDALRVVGVARQSRTRDGSMSVADQVARMRAAAASQNYQLVEVFEEQDVSGGAPLAHRRGLRRAVEAVEAGRADVVMVAYFDRLARSLKVQNEVVDRVEDAGGAVQTLDHGQVTHGTAAQWLSSNTLGMMSEYYKRSVGERTADSKQANIDRGVPPFPRITPAYVRREDGTLAPHPTNAPLVREASKMRAAGVSFVKIARWLGERGLAISPSGVESMLASRLLVGEIHFGDFRPNLDAVEEPIVDRATFRQMQAAKSTRGRYAKSDRLLARLGVLVCETCGSRMTVHSTSHAGQRYSYYRCGDRLCGHPAVIAADTAERVVCEATLRLSAEVVGRASAAEELEGARLRRDDAEEKLANAIRTLAGFAGEAATREVLDGLQAERNAAIEAHERLASLASPDLTLRTGEDWELLSFEAKRDVIRAVVSRASVAPGRGPDRVTVEGRTVES